MHGYAYTATTPKQINWLQDSWVLGGVVLEEVQWRRLFGVAYIYCIYIYAHSYNDIITTRILEVRFISCAVSWYIITCQFCLK